MSSIAANVGIGLLTTLAGGALVWIWERLRATRRRARYAAFFGFTRSDGCIIVSGSQINNPRGIHRSDVNALVEVASIAHQANVEFRILHPDEFREGTGRKVEFCLGGPNANSRTRAHLATYLPRIRFKPYDNRQPDSLAIVTPNHEFLREHDRLDYVLVARIFPSLRARPIFLIAGQTAISNLAAAHFIRSESATLAREYKSDQRFCLVLAVTLPDVYGHEVVRLKRDITGTVFAT